MNLKELKHRLDPKARYFWAKDQAYSWRLVNALTLKTVFGTEDSLTAVLLTRKLRALKFSVASPAGDEN